MPSHPKHRSEGCADRQHKPLGCVARDTFLATISPSDAAAVAATGGGGELEKGQESRGQKPRLKVQLRGLTTCPWTCHFSSFRRTRMMVLDSGSCDSRMRDQPGKVGHKLERAVKSFEILTVQ